MTDKDKGIEDENSEPFEDGKADEKKGDVEIKRFDPEALLTDDSDDRMEE